MPGRREEHRAQRWIWAAVLGAVVGGCHAPGPAQPKPPQAGQVVVDVSAGTRVATRVRATPGQTRVSLFVDAGSRDATPAQVATIAAWAAADGGGAELQALVTPDLTEIARECPSRELERCLRQLRTALDARSPSEALLARLRERVRDGRRRALAADEHRMADAAALRALLGAAADGFFPLGEATADAAVDAAAVSAFSSAHYGPSRALIVVAGDAEPERVRSAVAKAFAGARAAGSTRAARELPAPQSDGQVEVRLGERGALTFALSAPSLSAARDYAFALQDALVPAGDDDADVRGDVFEVRGGALALLRVSGAPPEQLLLSGTRELARLAVEPPPSAAAPVDDDDLAGVSRAFARRWCYTPSAARPAPARFAFAAGALVKGGRGDDPRSADPNAAELARAQERLKGAALQGQVLAHPRTRGSIDANAASVVTDNGARIEVRRQAADRVAISVRSALGAGEDLPLGHGRAALLATLSSTACVGLGPESLRDELARLGATLTPRVDAESYGLLLSIPATSWRQGLSLALRCMLAPSRDPVHFADAALRLQARLGGATSPLTLRARVASLVAPRAPGLCAPWGHPELLGNLSPSALAQSWPRALSGARLAVAIYGAVDVPDAVARVARRVAALPAGTAPPTIDAGTPVPPPPAVSTSGVATRVLVVWLARDAGASTVAARVAASALDAWLRRVSGVETLAHDSGAFGKNTWASVALRVAPEVVPGLPALLAQAGRGVDASVLNEALAHASEQDRALEARAGSQLDSSAERLARERLLGGQSAAVSGKPEDATSVARALLSTAPTYLSLD